MKFSLITSLTSDIYHKHDSMLHTKLLLKFVNPRREILLKNLLLNFNEQLPRYKHNSKLRAKLEPNVFIHLHK